MRKTRFEEEKIFKILHEGEARRKVQDGCRDFGISEQTYYRWKGKYGGLQVSEAKRLRAAPDGSIELSVRISSRGRCTVTGTTP